MITNHSVEIIATLYQKVLLFNDLLLGPSQNILRGSRDVSTPHDFSKHNLTLFL